MVSDVVTRSKSSAAAARLETKQASQGPEPVAVLALALTFILISLAPPELSAAICLLFFAVITIGWRPKFTAIGPLWPTLLFTGIGIVTTGFWGVEESVVLYRSAFYVLYPVIMLFLGIVIPSIARQGRTYYRAIVYAGIVLSGIYIAQYFMTDLRGASRVMLRSTIGTGFLISAFGAALLLVHPRYMPWPRLVSYLLVPFCLLSNFLADSRTNLIAGVVIVGTLLLLRPARVISTWLAVGMTVLLMVLTTPFLTDLLGPVTAEQVRASGILGELFSEEYFRKSDINTNWRGFESAVTFSYVRSLGFLPAMFGLGWGITVPLGLTITLGSTDLSQIGKFHSIYSQLLMRGGYLGIALYCIQIWLLSRACVRASSIDDNLHRFAFGVLLCTVISGPAIGGLYGIGGSNASFAIIAGIIVGSAGIQRRVRPNTVTSALSGLGSGRDRPRTRIISRKEVNGAMADD